MRITILFGGTNKERLVSVASAQALCEALPDADLWFWDADDSVHETERKTLLEHARPFEHAFKPGGRKIAATIEAAYNDKAGVTAEFTLNLLMRLNRELGSDFDLTILISRQHTKS